MRGRLTLLAGLLAVPSTATAHEVAGAATAAPAAGSLWPLAAAASLAMTVTFLAIAGWMWRSILAGDQLLSNPLLTGMALIFTTCAVGHLIHFEHVMLPIYAPAAAAWLGLGDAAHAVGFGTWARIAMVDPILLGTDIVTALLGGWYFTLRRQQRSVLHGAALSDDLRAREREAHMMHDSVVQTVAEAQILLEMGRHKEAVETIQAAIDESQTIVDTFLETPGGLQPGDLRRVEGSEV